MSVNDRPVVPAVIKRQALIEALEGLGFDPSQMVALRTVDPGVLAVDLVATMTAGAGAMDHTITVRVED